MPKRAHAAGCAVVGVYENGDLGVAARQIDTQLDGTDRHACTAAAISPRSSATPCCCRCRPGAAAARVLLIGLGTRAGFGRKQYRKALAVQRVRRSPRPARATRSCTWRWSRSPDLDVQYRARIVAEVFCAQTYKIPDLKTGAKPKAPPLVDRQRGGGRCARRESGGGRVCASAPRSAAGSRCRARSCQSAAQCLHADLYGNPRAGVGQGVLRASRPRYWTRTASRRSRWARSWR